MEGAKAMEAVAKRNMKFDNNDIESNMFRMDPIPESAKRSERDMLVQAMAEKIIKEKKIGNQVMKVLLQLVKAKLERYHLEKQLLLLDMGIIPLAV